MPIWLTGIWHCILFPVGGISLHVGGDLDCPRLESEQNTERRVAQVSSWQHHLKVQLYQYRVVAISRMVRFVAIDLFCLFCLYFLRECFNYIDYHVIVLLFNYWRNCKPIMSLKLNVLMMIIDLVLFFLEQLAVLSQA